MSRPPPDWCKVVKKGASEDEEEGDKKPAADMDEEPSADADGGRLQIQEALTSSRYNCFALLIGSEKVRRWNGEEEGGWDERLCCSTRMRLVSEGVMDVCFRVQLSAGLGSGVGRDQIPEHGQVRYDQTVAPKPADEHAEEEEAPMDEGEAEEPEKEDDEDDVRGVIVSMNHSSLPNNFRGDGRPHDYDPVLFGTHRLQVPKIPTLRRPVIANHMHPVGL
jgi:hypothetical protein